MADEEFRFDSNLEKLIQQIALASSTLQETRKDVEGVSEAIKNINKVAINSKTAEILIQGFDKFGNKVKAIVDGATAELKSLETISKNLDIKPQFSDGVTSGNSTTGGADQSRIARLQKQTQDKLAAASLEQAAARKKASEELARVEKESQEKAEAAARAKEATQKKSNETAKRLGREALARAKADLAERDNLEKQAASAAKKRAETAAKDLKAAKDREKRIIQNNNKALKAAIQEAAKIIKNGSPAKVKDALDRLGKTAGPDKARRALILLNKELDKTRQNSDALALSFRNFIRFEVFSAIRNQVANVTQLLREGVEQAFELQQAIAEIQTIGGTNATQLESILQKQAEATGIDVVTQAEAAYQAFSNQVVQTTSDLEQFLTTSNTLAIGTLSTTDAAVNALSSSLNAYGKNVSQAEGDSAIFFKTVELGRVRLEEMANTIGQTLIPAAQIGIQFEEVSAAIATLTTQGVKFNQAQTLVRNVILKLIKPTDELKNLFSEIGVESGEAAIQAFGFGGVIAKVEEATKGSTTELGKLFGRIRAITGTLGLAGENAITYRDNLRKMRLEMVKVQAEQLKQIRSNTVLAANYEDLQKRIAKATAELGGSDEDTALSKGVTKIQETDIKSLERELADVQGVFRSFGQEAIAILRFITKDFTLLSEAARLLGVALNIAGVALAGFAAVKTAQVILVGVAALTAFTTGLTTASGAAGVFALSMNIARNALITLNLAFLANPIGIALVAIAAASALYVALTKDVKDATDQLKDLNDELNKTAQAGERIIRIGLEFDKAQLRQARRDVGSFVADLNKNLIAGVGSAEKALLDVAPALGKSLTAASGLFKEAISFAKKQISSLKSDIKGVTAFIESTERAIESSFLTISEESRKAQAVIANAQRDAATGLIISIGPFDELPINEQLRVTKESLTDVRKEAARLINLRDGFENRADLKNQQRLSGEIVSLLEKEGELFLKSAKLQEASSRASLKELGNVRGIVALRTKLTEATKEGNRQLAAGLQKIASQGSVKESLAAQKLLNTLQQKGLSLEEARRKVISLGDGEEKDTLLKVIARAAKVEGQRRANILKSSGVSPETVKLFRESEKLQQSQLDIATSGLRAQKNLNKIQKDNIESAKSARKNAETQLARTISAEQDLLKQRLLVEVAITKIRKLQTAGKDAFAEGAKELEPLINELKGLFKDGFGSLDFKLGDSKDAELIAKKLEDAAKELGPPLENFDGTLFAFNANTTEVAKNNALLKKLNDSLKGLTDGVKDSEDEALRVSKVRAEGANALKALTDELGKLSSDQLGTIGAETSSREERERIDNAGFTGEQIDRVFKDAGQSFVDSIAPIALKVQSSEALSDVEIGTLKEFLKQLKGIASQRVIEGSENNRQLLPSIKVIEALIKKDDSTGEAFQSAPILRELKEQTKALREEQTRAQEAVKFLRSEIKDEVVEGSRSAILEAASIQADAIVTAIRSLIPVDTSIPAVQDFSFLTAPPTSSGARRIAPQRGVDGTTGLDQEAGTTFGDINVTVEGGSTDQKTADTIVTTVKRAIRTGRLSIKK